MFTYLDLPLYALDTDQTYDLVYAVNIHPNIFSFLKKIRNFPIEGVLDSIFGPRFLMLFDRRSPDGYPWCERYSSLIYEFLKDFTVTGQYEHSSFSQNGNKTILGDRLEYKLTHPQNYFYFQFDFSEQTITNTTNKPVYLTYFTDAFADGNSLGRVSINKNTHRNIELTTPTLGRIYNKVAIKIAPIESFIVDKHCAFGSVMISNLDGSRNETLEEQLPNYYRYDKLEEFLIIFWDEIRDGFKRMGQYASHTYFTETFRPNNTYATLAESASPETDFEPVCISYPSTRNQSFFSREFYYSLVSNEITSIEFSDVPNWYRFASLIYGDPDIANRGKAIKVFFVGNQMQFRLWDWGIHPQSPISFLLPDFNRDEQQSFAGLLHTVTNTFYDSFYEITCEYPVETWTGAIVHNYPHFEPYLQFEPDYYEVTKAFIDGQFSRLTQSKESENTNMPDSIRVKEIHQALDASRYAYFAKEGKTYSRTANLGYYLERLARVLGISVNPDGSPKSIRQSKHVPQGAKIPVGWLIGQWGSNEGDSKEGQRGGNKGELRDGIAYEVIGNKFTKNPFTGEPNKIEEGGYVLCENLPQYLEILKDDIDKCLGLQSASANALPNAEKTDYIAYEGLHTLLAEAIFMLSSMSKQQQETWVSSLSAQAMSQEILAAFGTSIEIKEITVEIDKKPYKIPYPGLDDKAPTMFNMFSAVLQNIAPILLSVSRLRVRQQQVEVKEEEYAELGVPFISRVYDYSLKILKKKEN